MSEIGRNVLLVQFSYQMAVTQPKFTNIECSVSNRYTSNVLSAREQEWKMITNCEWRIYMHGLRKAMRHPSLHKVRPSQKPESLPVQPMRPSRICDHRGSALANVPALSNDRAPSCNQFVSYSILQYRLYTVTPT